MSNRKAHRRARSFHRAEKFVQHRLRRPGRSERRLRALARKALRALERRSLRVLEHAGGKMSPIEECT